MFPAAAADDHYFHKPDSWELGDRPLTGQRMNN
jgi:hypothetical protein